MAGNQQFDPNSYLDEQQQNLLLAALSSNMNVNKLQQNSFSASSPDLTSLNNAQFSNTLDPSFFASPQQNSGALSTFDTFGVEESPYLEFAEGDPDFDFGNIDGDESLIGPLPGEDGLDIHEKRKSPEDGEGSTENDSKRQEGEDKVAKKPGRKPLTSEPTTKRKAQNRAAQRAFRERKEKHLKDLETKVDELEKQSEAEKHENGLLRAQVDRLQTELREYRKRLSLSSGRVGGSPPVGGYSSYLASLANQQAGGTGNNFQFEFPKFGGLPGAHIFNNGQLAKQNGNAANGTQQPARQASLPGSVNRANSTTSVASGTSPQSVMNSVGSPEKQAAGETSGFIDPTTGLFSNTNGSTSGQDNQRTRSGTDASTGRSRIFQFNSGSISSNSGSPSASSNSQFGNATSSGVTTPEQTHHSPSNKADANFDVLNAEKGYVCHGNSEGEIMFCEKLNMACGNPRNPTPRAKSFSDGAAAPSTTTAATAKPDNDTTTATAPSVTSPSNGIDTMASQNGGAFDPSLFGDYRDSNAAIVGDGDFTGGFFDAAFPMPDFGSPFNALQTPGVAKTNPLDEIERMQENGGDDADEVVPGDDMSQMLNCHKIWDTLQQNDGFKEGSVDIDGLCSELRAKARCSESGVVVDQKDVDAALKRLPKASPQPLTS